MVGLEFNEVVKIRGEEDVPVPRYNCATCTRCNLDEKRCNFHQRRVEPKFNKCFEHSSYGTNPIKAVFTQLPKEVMDRLLEENELMYG